MTTSRRFGARGLQRREGGALLTDGREAQARMMVSHTLTHASSDERSGKPALELRRDARLVLVRLHLLLDTDEEMAWGEGGERIGSDSGGGTIHCPHGLLAWLGTRTATDEEAAATGEARAGMRYRRAPTRSDERGGSVLSSDDGLSPRDVRLVLVRLHLLRDADEEMAWDEGGECEGRDGQRRRSRTRRRPCVARDTDPNVILALTHLDPLCDLKPEALLEHR
ncbi:hypothetical protein B0H19DRAFT_1265544 [Mycena capillaripes]|nr:hypothetical protein B0H19DRAFT_1265544 [Mycena capillaripes]